MNPAYDMATEIWDNCFRYCSAKEDLQHLRLTCCRFCSIASRLLFQSVSFSFSQPAVPKTRENLEEQLTLHKSVIVKHISERLWNLATNPDLADLVRKVNIIGIGDFSIHQGPLLPYFVAFQSDLQVLMNQLDLLLPRFQKMKSIRAARKAPLRNIPALSKVSMIVADRHRRLLKLDAPNQGLGVSSAHAIVTLNNFLRACTDLKELAVRGFVPSPGLRAPLPTLLATACPRLRAFSGSPELARVIAPGRPIERLDLIVLQELRLSENEITEMLSYMKQKSKSEIRELSLSRLMLSSTTFQGITDLFPGLHKLTARFSDRERYYGADHNSIDLKRIWEGLAIGKYLLPTNIREICFKNESYHSSRNAPEFTTRLHLLGTRYTSLQRVSMGSRGPQWDRVPGGQWVEVQRCV
ncbi:hypothetical protein CPB84DRAFT_1761783 [Gymnopilus junonius]|uniref:F-box domain-containing protein n=1 Tax=Gymnopilus junonius TaxID=109634 RepID=A0A9P5TUY3_GYMJU|nr:hypothetical protein CPB84DRAFT_1796003 [Gymnopilus junonius]KAF8912252.1 hypothetical protein CPB84DRAFT_1761783 [Gymnopilus junonius]